MTNSNRWATIFKTHFWDDFAERQFRRLSRGLDPENVFIITDETKRKVHGIHHPRVLRMTEKTSADQGYLHYPKGNLFWYNTDYQIYHFFDRHPEYEYAVFCEYDCVVNFDLATLVRAMIAQNLDFIGEPIPNIGKDWHWFESIQSFYPDTTAIAGRLVCFAIFRQTLARQLQTARLEHTERVLSRSSPEAKILWPNNEAFVGSEITRLGARERSLSSFGNTSHYNWSPPVPEGQLPSLNDCALIHPVLDGPRFLRSVRKMNAEGADLFREGSTLSNIFASCDVGDVVSDYLPYIAQSSSWHLLEQLKRYVVDRTGSFDQDLFNVSKGKPATQSSTSTWSRFISPSKDASGAVDGRPTGEFGFHTDIEDAPWWAVDLEAVYPVRLIRIHNRKGLERRARTLLVSASSNLVDWTILYRHRRETVWGKTAPLELTFPEPTLLRFLRLSLDEPEILHLDEIEVFV